MSVTALRVRSCTRLTERRISAVLGSPAVVVAGALTVRGPLLRHVDLVEDPRDDLLDGDLPRLGFVAQQDAVAQHVVRHGLDVVALHVGASYNFV